MLNTENNKNENYLEAVTADSAAIYAAGFVQSSSFYTSDKVATITRTNVSTMAWAWRRVYTEPTDRLNTITALALNPSGTKVAAYGWRHMSLAGSVDGYVFTVDAISGWKVSEILKIDHNSRTMEVKSARMLMDSNDVIYMAFYQISGSFYNNWESRLRIASYNSATSTLGWIKEQTDYYGRAGALTFGSSPHGTDYLYLGGSGNDDNEDFYLSISQINFDGTLYYQHYLEPE